MDIKTEAVQRIAFAIEACQRELIRAKELHADMHSAHEGYAVILEELDELKAEVWKKNKDVNIMREEALHVAATALRFIVDVCNRPSSKRDEYYKQYLELEQKEREETK